MKKFGMMTLFFLASLLLTGCTNFERDWRHALVKGPPPAESIEGPWQGKWLSEVNGHTGDLRCLVTDKGADLYEFRFKAGYWKVFRYSYTVSMPVQCAETNCTFSGKEHLGWLAGGVYKYQGTMTGTNLNATYHCKFDHGTFQMQRP